MLHPAGGGAEKNVRNKPVPMRAHGHKVAAFALHPADDLLDRIAVGQLGFCGDPRR